MEGQYWEGGPAKRKNIWTATVKGMVGGVVSAMCQVDMRIERMENQLVDLKENRKVLEEQRRVLSELEDMPTGNTTVADKLVENLIKNWSE
jgi:hypothetical protein